MSWWLVPRAVWASEQLCLQSLSAPLGVAWPGSPAHTALFVPQEDLLPRGIAVFRRALESYRGAGCQRGHHRSQTQRQHPGEG